MVPWANSVTAQIIVRTLTLLSLSCVCALGQLQDFAIDHIEFVQVVQNHDNTVPLIAGKNTVARVFLRSSPSVPETTGISGLLTASGSHETLPTFGCLLAI